MQKLRNLLITNKILIFCIIVSIFLIFTYATTNTKENSYEPLEKVTFNGVYKIDDNKWHSLSDDAKLSTLNNSTITIKGHFDKDIEKNKQLLFYLCYLEATISKNGKEIYSFGKENTYSNMMKSAGAIWGHFYSGGISQSDEIKIILKTKYQNNYNSAFNDFLNNIYIGDTGTLLKQLVKHDIFTIIIGIVFLISGIILFIVSIIMKIKHFLQRNDVICFSSYMIGVSIWFLISGNYISLIIKNNVFILILETIILCVIPIFILEYVKTFIKSKASKILTFLQSITILYIFAYMIMQLLKVADAYSSRQSVVIIYSILELVMSVIIIHELFYIKDSQAKTALSSMLILTVFGVAESLNYSIEFAPKSRMSIIGFTIVILIQSTLSIKYIMSALTKAKNIAIMENEIINSRISMMLSQIKPHFLYNALNTIQYLCETDSKKAGKIVESFANYLRGNMDSLNQKELIPLERELQHVKYYLDIEQVRFDDINIVYNLKTLDFMVPSLTIQPLVENAVKHGLRQKKGGGTITISTNENIHNYYIIIKDNGVGFVPIKNTDTTNHIGIENTSSRIQLMCNGTLKINSQKNIGTTIIITIPKGKS